MSNIIVLQFKLLSNSHFGILRGSGKPSAVKLQPVEVRICTFWKNTKWPPQVWFGLEICWLKNKSCSFSWSIGGVQNLGSVWPKLNELRQFFIFAYFGYWATASWSLRGWVWPQTFLLRKKVTYFCESMKKCKILDLCDQNWVSYGYFSVLQSAFGGF